MTLTLGVVDQSPVRRGGTAAEALEESVLLAQRVEALGFHRFWVAEHHNTGGFAGTTPEILIGQIAARTSRIRVGSGGVMLTHYSALKVAETFRVLNAFYPGRIDLGIGRAPGSDQLTARALVYPRAPMDVRQFPQQLVDLMGFLTGEVDSDAAFGSVQVQAGPRPELLPEVWLLGSSDYSARLAAALGLPFAFADFFGMTDIGPSVAALYREQFQPSEWLDAPRVNAAIQVICAETEERARFIASSRNLSRANMLRGIRGQMYSPEEASKLLGAGTDSIGQLTHGAIDGDPEQVRQGLLAAAARYETDDLSIVSNCFFFEDRVRSYQLVAEAMGLTPANLASPREDGVGERAARE